MSSDIPDLEEFESYLKQEKITKLYEFQKKAIAIISKGRSVLVATPTSSGKTVVAYYGILRAWKMGLRSLYIVPLRALAEEKFEEMKSLSDGKIKIAISTGDYDRPSDYLKGYDVIVATSEKVDSILRNNPSALDRLGFIVFDEIHNIQDETRGSTLEIVVSKIREAIEGAQFVAMSATVRNSGEIASWLGADEIKSDFRPVPLQKFILTSDAVYDEAGEIIEEVYSFDEFVKKTLSNSGQTLIFVRSRREAESTAERLSKVTQTMLGEQEKKELDALSIESDALGTEKLIPLLKKGAAFHHAGMLSEHRRLVERLFRERKIKVVVATTTLAAGLNLPARSVIIKDTFRYNGYASTPISNLEVQQMLGRAGRIKYDSVGYGYIYSTKTRVMDTYATYIEGELENIVSRLDERKTRMHVLGLVSSGMCRSRESLYHFFQGTLAHFQGISLDSWIDQSISFLKENAMISGESTLKATPFGKKVSELYIDPLTGVILRKAVDLENIDDIILGISSTPDMPPLYVSDKEEELFAQRDLPFDVTPESAKVAAILSDWIEEVPEEKIIERYKIWPADLRSRVEVADWLSHSLYELSRVLNRPRTDLRVLNYRIANGVLPDIVSLTFLPGVGRVRARRLKLNGFDLERIANANPAEIERIQGFGSKLAESIIKSAKSLVEKGVTVGL
ncbi:MAG: DEAD/DEAH box helicase [Thermoplasmatales archaeon]